MLVPSAAFAPELRRRGLEGLEQILHQIRILREGHPPTR
jgi:hypothetical protein